MKTVMLVDDQLDIQEMLADLLRNHGIRVEAYANGEQALERLKDNFYDLIITDMHMPKVNGYTLITEMQNNNPISQDMPVIIITGGQKAIEYQDQIEKLSNQNKITVLEKPFSKQQFLDCVCEAFGVSYEDIYKLAQEE